MENRYTRSAGDSPAVTRAARPRFGSVTIRDRGRLPHWEVEGGTYFVTFRLADSLPSGVAEEIAKERKRLGAAQEQGNRQLTQAERRGLERASFAKLERYLDEGAGSCWFRNAAVADIVAQNLRFFDCKRYHLYAWCVMPNHVHVAFKAFPSFGLAAIVHGWKSYTAKKANQILTRVGEFWQREYFDRLVRDEAELTRTMKYIHNNPVKAGLQNWKWVEVCGPAAHMTAGEPPALR